MDSSNSLGHYLHFVHYRAVAELKRDASNMFLGSAWWVIEPLLYMAVFYVVFGLGLRKGGIEYVCFLLCALVPWKWFESSLKSASNTIYNSAGLMRQVYFPKWILPAYVIAANSYKFLILLVLLLAFMVWSKGGISLAWLWLMPIVVLQFLLIVGISLLFSALVPLIPDLRYVIAYGVTLLFFLSGIFFDINELAEPIRSYLSWLPTVLIIDMYRGVLLHNTAPSLFNLLLLGIEGIIFYTTAWIVLIKLDRYYPRVIA